MSNARAHRAAWLAAIVVVALGFGVALVKVFNENLVFFYTPTQILGGEVPTGEKPIAWAAWLKWAAFNARPIRSKFALWSAT